MTHDPLFIINLIGRTAFFIGSLLIFACGIERLNRAIYTRSTYTNWGLALLGGGLLTYGVIDFFINRT